MRPQGRARAVVISAGFKEIGPEGAKRDERALVDGRARHGMRLVGPNCLGVLNTEPAVRLTPPSRPVYPPPGRVAFSSQSGALGLAILDYASELNLGISQFVSVGNKADVSGNDLLEFWEQDPGTDVILLYLESFGNPRRFTQIARRVAPQEADRRGEERPHDERRARRLVAHRLARRLGRRGRRALPADRRDPHRHHRGAVRHGAAARQPAGAARSTGRDRHQRGRPRDHGVRRLRDGTGSTLPPLDAKTVEGAARVPPAPRRARRTRST